MNIPEKVGKYKLGSEINRGGMGIVFHGMDEDLKRPLAIKMLPKEIFADQEQKDRFLLEARIVAKLDHPNIMRVYSIEFAEETVWIAMELLEGQLLSKLIQEQGKIPVPECTNIVSQLIQALAYAHSKGIIHRDIKPGNVMINKEGIVKLMDFGIARDEDADMNLTQAGTIMGTPKYMSPEQFTGALIDKRSDIYSLGIMTFEMLAGKVPFEGKSIPEMAYKQMHEMPPDIKTITPDISSLLLKFVNESLKKNKNERLSSLSEVNFNSMDMATIHFGTKIAKQKVRPYKYALYFLISLFIFLSIFFTARHQQQKAKAKVLVENILKEMPLLLEKKEWVNAKSRLAEALSIDKNNLKIHEYLKTAENLELIDQKKVEARNLYTESLRLLEQNRIDAFKQLVDQAHALDPGSFYKKQGGENLLIHFKKTAQKYYENAIQFYGNNQFEPAQNELKKCIELDSTHVKAYLTYCDLYIDLEKEFDETYFKFFEKALLIDPHQKIKWIHLSNAYSETGKKQQAKSTCEKGLSFFPDSQKLKRLLKTLS